MTAPAIAGPAAGAVFDAALIRAGAGRPVTLTLRDPGTDAVHPVDVAGWCAETLPGDRALLARCTGPTLDVGCGPGRLTVALTRDGVPALGIDLSAVAVRLARSRGAPAMRRDVFARLPGNRRWPHLLLADGNIGIGGDPERLLRRCRDLLAPDGSLHAEVTPPGAGSWAADVRLHDTDGPPSTPFRWAAVAADDLPAAARPAGLRVRSTWTEAGRWFATLSPH